MNETEHTSRKALLTIRPQIPTIAESATSTAERFQNTSLRPILKLQNDLFVAVMRQYFHKRKNVFPTLSRTRQAEYIAHCIRKDLKFKNRLLGMVIGQMTLAEYDDFVAEESELTRRITTMLIERMQDQLIDA
ncbi:MAG: glyoxalase [Bacteroidota bacterium]